MEPLILIICALLGTAIYTHVVCPVLAAVIAHGERKRAQKRSEHLKVAAARYSVGKRHV